VSVDVDCDGDTLLFQVRQSGNACHFDRYSCFVRQQPEFNFKTLQGLLEKRMAELPENSFTTKLFKSAEFRAEKIREEAEELIEAQAYEDVRWEAADLIFFALVDALAKGVSVERIEQELGGRFNDR
jgi:phosphoribosyl-ATP pyrophosphohydrolase